MIDASAPPMRMRFSYESRCRAVQLMESGTSVAQAARMCGASRATGYRWWARYRAEGWRGLHERPPIPHHQPRRLSPEAEAEILAVRLRSNEGPQRVGAIVGRAASTVGKVLPSLGVLTSSEGTPAHRPPLRTGAAGRAAAHRYQEAGALLAGGASASAKTAFSAAHARVGTTSTSLSMTTRALPTARCSPARERATRWPSSSVPIAGMPNRTSPWSRS